MSSWHQAQWNGEIKNENELATGSENETGKICYMIDENDEKRPYDISLPPAVRVLWLECWKWENRLMRKKETIWEVGTFRARQDLPPNSHLRRCCGWESAFKLIGRLRKVWIWKNEGVRKRGGLMRNRSVIYLEGIQLELILQVLLFEKGWVLLRDMNF